MAINKKFREDFLKVAVNFEKSELTTFGPGKGSISARDLGSGQILITPSGLGFSQLLPDDLIVLGLDGKKISGDLKPSLDSVFHLAVYRARTDVGGIIHTHSPYATSYACSGKPILPMIMGMVIMVGGQADVAPFAFPGTKELGENIVRALGKKNATIMEQHGVLAVGKTLSRALSVASTLENTAQIQFLCESRGELRPLDEKTVLDGIEFEKGYGQGKNK